MFYRFRIHKYLSIENLKLYINIHTRYYIVRKWAFFPVALSLRPVSNGNGTSDEKKKKILRWRCHTIIIAHIKRLRSGRRSCRKKKNKEQ